MRNLVRFYPPCLGRRVRRCVRYGVRLCRRGCGFFRRLRHRPCVRAVHFARRRAGRFVGRLVGLEEGRLRAEVRARDWRRNAGKDLRRICRPCALRVRCVRGDSFCGVRALPWRRGHRHSVRRHHCDRVDRRASRSVLVFAPAVPLCWAAIDFWVCYLVVLFVCSLDLLKGYCVRGGHGNF